MANTPDEFANATKGSRRRGERPARLRRREPRGLGVTVDRLASITTALNDSRDDVKQVLHIAPTVFQNFMNIYQPAQSSVTGILAPVNFANTVQFICSAIQAASRQGCEQSSKLCVQYLAPIIKNRQYNFPPLGFNPFVGASARPNEITYSEDRLNPNLPPPPLAVHRRRRTRPLPAEAPLPRSRARAAPTDPASGLQD